MLEAVRSSQFAVRSSQFAACRLGRQLIACAAAFVPLMSAAAQEVSITSATSAQGATTVSISFTVTNAPSGLAFQKAEFKDANGKTLTPTTLTGTYNNGPNTIVPDKPAGATKVRIRHGNGVTAWVTITLPPA